MTRNLLRAGALACALMTSTAFCTQAAIAQTAPAPRFSQVDANGVDLISGRFVFGMTEGSIGTGPGAVSIERSQRDDYGRTDQWSGLMYRRTSGGTSVMVVQFGGRSDTFSISGGSYTSTTGSGAALTGFSGGYTYRAADGTTISYSSVGPDLGYPVSGPGCSLGDAGTCAVPVQLTRPDGTSFALSWEFVERCHQYDEQLDCLQPAAYVRFAGVASSTGYGFTFTYASNNPGLPSQGAPPPNWFRRTGAAFTNSVNPPSSAPTISYATPSSGVEEVTDTAGRTWRIASNGSGQITGLRRPGSSADDISISYGTGGVVSSVTKDGVTTSYSRSVSGTIATTTITNALSQQTVVVADLAKERVTAVTDGLNRTTGFQYDASSRLTRTTAPEGNYTQLTYDARGNVTQTRHVGKSGSGLADIVTTASYDASCANPVVCNRPNSVTDARGNVTDFSYDATHGGVVSVTAPAATGGAARAQTRYGYSLLNGEYRLTTISACSSGTAPGCVGTANESRTVIGYDTQGNVTSVEQRDGTGALSATQTATYDAIGNLLTVDGPLSGTGDTIRYRYNAARQVIGVIGPDPDGSGALKHRAVRTNYRSDGRATSQEVGTVNSQSDSDWANMAVLQAVQAEYDPNDRPVVRKLVSGSTVYGLSQVSYDALGRPECSAGRMNPNEFATTSLPSSACTLDTEGGFGPDRIVRNSYDAAGQVTLVQSGYGVTGVQADEVAATYRSNGQVETLTDGEGNRTTYVYDGHDRRKQTRYPVATRGANQSSTTDYEELSYDQGSNVTTFRLRDGNSIGITYDALNRPTAKDLPGSDPDVAYTFDLLGRLTGASQAGHALNFTHDALGRQLTEMGPHGTISSAYDPAGRRTRLTHPDGNWIDFDRLVTGELTWVRENGSGGGQGVPAIYGYDDLGRRTTLTRGSGAVASYSYDAVSRLSQISENAAGTAHDQTITFGYNPAGQIVSRTATNDAYAFGAVTNQSVTDTHNGHNQVTATGSVTVGHDARGNTNAIGPAGYAYDSQNRMTSGSAATLAYDPLGRLYEVSGSGGTTRLQYDGADLIAERDGAGTLLRRYAHGAATDDPLVWYEGGNLQDRRWLHADERGSIVGRSDANGNVAAVNRYDEYGRPDSGNTGRFGYTGQAWVPELGLWYYKARMYNPQLGRFMQADPIGYGDGMNLYGYVGGDPVNFRDPSGLRVQADGIDCKFEIIWTRAGPTCGGDPKGPEGFYNAPYGGGSGPGGGGGKGGNGQPQCTGGQAIDAAAVAGGAITATPPRSGNPPSIDKEILDFLRLLGRGLTLTFSLSGSTPQRDIPLFRAVAPAEFSSIISTGQFSIAPGGLEGKQFWLSLTDATFFATVSISSGHELSYTIVSTAVSQSTLSQAESFFAEGGRLAYHFAIPALPALNADAARNGIQTIGQCGG